MSSPITGIHKNGNEILVNLWAYSGKFAFFYNYISFYLWRMSSRESRGGRQAAVKHVWKAVIEIEKAKLECSNTQKLVGIP